MLLYIIIATIIISAISLVGIIVSQDKIHKFLHYFISFAAGTLIAAALIDLIPHALEGLEEVGVHIEKSIIFVVVGIALFYLIEKFIHWHHCDKHECKETPAGALILIGDFVHNFIDGVLVAGAFVTNFSTGIITTIIVVIHEIPQEFGDFAVLLHSGFTKKRALFLNFISALSAVIGGIAGFFVFDMIEGISPYAVLITAGGFLYIALSDIMPAMHHHEHNRRTVLTESLIFVATIVAMYFFLGMMHGH